ncbi:unnamed protein product [Brassica rapa]|uniref:FCP1 homology domain-containing protein n=1 Tax=Brassica campestris TaxID=3711 RepID=A0A8D9DMS7_BRACM|nr:unnamed protein product [Brassica rapa]
MPFPFGIQVASQCLPVCLLNPQLCFACLVYSFLYTLQEVNEKTPRPSAFNTQPPSSLDYVGPVCDKLHPNGYIPYKLPRGATKYDNRKRYRDLSTLNRDPKRILYVSGNAFDTSLTNSILMTRRLST